MPLPGEGAGAGGVGAEPASTDDGLEPGLGRRLLAIVLLFLGLSAANAAGGLLQLAFFAACLVVALRTPHELPRRAIALAVACGIIAAMATLRYDPSPGPGVAVVRPIVEGYLVAVAVYACGIRTAASLTFVLGGYLLLQVAAAGAMLALPGLRLGLLESWYAGEGYQNQAFLGALVFRGFGVSKHHLYGLPLAAGTIAALLVITSRLRTSGAARAASLALAAAGVALVLLNARIGFVPVLLCYALGVALFHRRFYVRQLLLVVPLAAVALVALAQAYLGDSFSLVSSWLLAGVSQFADPDATAGATTVSDLGEMVVLPTSGLGWLVGEGRLCEPGDACYSDIGWIRMLQVGGLLLVAAVSVLYAGLIAGMFRGRLWSGTARLQVDGDSRRQLTWLFALTFVAATVKGESFGSSDYSRLLVMLSVLAGLVDAPSPAGEADGAPGPEPVVGT